LSPISRAAVAASMPVGAYHSTSPRALHPTEVV
jgi:hypothetical protein